MYFPQSILAFIGDVGGPEMMMIFLVILVLFGGKKMPELARGLGKSIREFKKATSNVEEEIKKAIEETHRAPEPKPTLTAPAPAHSVEQTNPFLSPPAAPEKDKTSEQGPSPV